MRTLFIAILGTLLVSCNEPLSMIPGGKLAGDTLAAPVAWTDVPETIQVETRPSDPYSINIWGVGIEQNLYIATGPDGTTWSVFIEDNPDVRVRMGNSVYELLAMSVTDSTERSVVTSAYVDKYDLDREDNWVKTGLIFRLDRRTVTP